MRLDGGDELQRWVRIRLKKGDSQAVATGDTVRLRVLVRPPMPPAYPGAWDLQRDAWFSGQGGSGYALGPLERIAETPPKGPLRLVQRLRETIAQHISAVVPGAAGAVSITLLTGITTGIPPPDHEAFRASGLAHLLAVAGLHIGIVMGWTLAFARLAFCGVGVCQSALADQEAGGSGGFGCRRRLYGADRHACADRAQFRHGVSLHRCRARRAAGDFAARPRSGGHGPDVAGAGAGAWRLAPDELFRCAGADLRLRGAATRTPRIARQRRLAAAIRIASGGTCADQRARRHSVRAIRGISFRPHPDLFRRGKHDCRAVDGTLGDAGRVDRPAAVAVRSRLAGLRADGLGR